MTIEIIGLHKHYNGALVLDDVTLTIGAGEFFALLGPSGSGKTTLLRVIAGLEAAAGGTLRIDGQDAGSLTPRDRHIGYVFQHYALFRHMTVFENVAFGLRVRPRAERPSRAEIAARVEELLGLVRLEGLGRRFPSQLSGGQRQRVALARALAVDPKVLLLDEPFGALDAQVRTELRGWLRELHDRIGLTTIFVTHDQEEALEIADRVAVFQQGRVAQVAPPVELYDSPVSPDVMTFLGAANRFACTASGGRLIWPAGFDGVTISPEAAARTTCALPDGPVVVFARPHDITVARIEGGRGTATVRWLGIRGARCRVTVEMPGGATVEADLPRDAAEYTELRPGDRVALLLRHVNIFPGTAAVPVTEAGPVRAAPQARRVVA
ncbi:MAG TPA: sulfate ABC transporter ATP-binding protein [Stellaceae bacterium]